MSENFQTARTSEGFEIEEIYGCYHTPMLYSDYVSWPDPPTTNSDPHPPAPEVPPWSRVHMGFIQKVLKAWLINVSDKASVSLTIIITCLISILDTATDIAIAYILFSSGNENAQNWAVVVVMCDYFPSWQLAVHNISSTTWRTRVKGRPSVADLHTIFATFRAHLWRLKP